MSYTYTMYPKQKYFAAYFFRGGTKTQERKGILDISVSAIVW